MKQASCALDDNWYFNLSLGHFSLYALKALIPEEALIAAAGVGVGIVVAGAAWARNYFLHRPERIVRKEEVFAAVVKKTPGHYGKFVYVICRRVLENPIPDDIIEKLHMTATKLHVRVGEDVSFTFRETGELAPTTESVHISYTHDVNDLKNFQLDRVEHEVTRFDETHARVHCVVSSGGEDKDIRFSIDDFMSPSSPHSSYSPTSHSTSNISSISSVSSSSQSRGSTSSCYTVDQVRFFDIVVLLFDYVLPQMHIVFQLSCLLMLHRLGVATEVCVDKTEWPRLFQGKKYDLLVG